jgi:hypothetical protein
MPAISHACARHPLPTYWNVGKPRPSCHRELKTLNVAEVGPVVAQMPQATGRGERDERVARGRYLPESLLADGIYACIVP